MIQKLKGYMTVLAITIATAGLYSAQEHGYFLNSEMAIRMLASILIYLVLGCAMKQIYKYRWALNLAHLELIVMYVSLYYSDSILDYFVFIICICILIYTIVELREIIILIEQKQSKLNPDGEIK